MIRRAVASAALLLLLQSVLASAQAAPIATQVGWLAGCWELSAGARRIEEQWMRPRAGLMLGVSRTVVGDSLREYEQVALFERGGRLVYAAAPARQAPAEFESIAVSDSAVTFENLTHDFPQRVIYRRRGADSLVARVEGMRGGQLRGVDYPYQRVACP
ncbi:MAG: DUF6265 family protein [Gemmatimonadales bacterium]